MNLYKKITDIIAKIASWIAMLAVVVIVFFIVSELIRRNIFRRRGLQGHRRRKTRRERGRISPFPIMLLLQNKTS